MAGFPVPGARYGKYLITRELGRGGMGVVYEATDTVLNRAMALKIVAPSLAGDDAFKARFDREAAVMAKIRSRHIVTVHEYGEQDGTYYLVTELIPDGDLDHWLKTRGPLTRPAALRLVAQVCEGLGDAHAAGVVHRDVKASNVLLWDRGEELIPYLCDFGIATDGDGSLTQTGSLVGSMGYLAPERYRGQPADERSDVYSVGCLLWTVLTGTPPYQGTEFQLMSAHTSDPIPQLAGTDPQTTEVNALLRGLMAKDPAQRVPTMAVARQLIANVDAAPLAQEPTVVRGTPAAPPAPTTSVAATQLIGPGGPGFLPPTTPVPPSAPRGRGRVVAAVAVVLAFAVLVSGGVWALTRDNGSADRPSTGTTPSRTPDSTPTDKPTKATTTDSSGPEASGPLDIAATFLDQGCSGDFLVILASADGSAPDSRLSNAVAGVSGAKYLRAATSCSAFRATAPDGSDIYNAYLGPFASLPQACTALSAISSETAWIRQLETPSKIRALCFCVQEIGSLPTISSAPPPSDLPKRRLLAQVQWALYKLGLNPDKKVYGNYSAEFVDQLAQYKGSYADPDTSATLGPAVWSQLQADYCSEDAFLE